MLEWWFASLDLEGILQAEVVTPSVTRRWVLWSALKSPREPSGEALTNSSSVSQSGHTAVTWDAF